MTSDRPVGTLPGWRHSRAWIFGTMVFSASLSLIASLKLSIDAWVLAGNPDAVFGCDVNAVISCGEVARSWQASLLGFPNAFIGLMTEPVVITLAVASLGGVRFPRWFMNAAQAVYLIGVFFAYWLFWVSATQIGALCPWCLLITVSTTLVFASLLHHNLMENTFGLPERAHQRALRALRMDVDVFVVGMLLTIMALVVVLKYGSAILA